MVVICDVVDMDTVREIDPFAVGEDLYSVAFGGERVLDALPDAVGEEYSFADELVEGGRI